MKKLFFDIKTTIKSKLGSVLEKPTQRHNRREQIDLDDCGNETCTLNQFLRIKKKQLIDLQEHWNRFCNVLPIFGFNSAKKNDPDLKKSYFIPIPVNERNLEPTVMKKANQFISLNLVIFSCWMLWVSLEAQQVLSPSWKHTKLKKHKDSSPTNRLITPTKCRIQNFRCMMLFTVNFAAVKPNALSKPNTLTILTVWKVAWPQDKQSSAWNYHSHPLLGLRIIITGNRHGKKSNWAHSRTFLQWCNN